MISPVWSRCEVHHKKNDLRGNDALPNFSPRERGVIVRQLLSGISFIVLALLGAHSAFAQKDIYSADYIVPGCRDFIGVDTGNAHLRGYCVDLAIGVARDAYPPRICLPREVTDEQIVRVVVQYIDSQPARLQEDFVRLATEALRKTWPCKRYPRPYAISGVMSAFGP
jgi:Rap1a immunity proteins